MKISINRKLIRRNKFISQLTLYLAIGFIVTGLLLSFANLDNSTVFLSYLVLLPAYIFMQINVFMAHKWGKNPRLDEIVTNALKGLDQNYVLYHYTTGVPHLLIGPAGIWLIKPYHQYGEISYDPNKKKYAQKGGGNFLTKFLSLDGVPDIDRETRNEISDFIKYMEAMGVKTFPEPNAVNVFYHKDATLQTRNAPHLVTRIDKLKDVIRQTARKKPISEDMRRKIVKILPEPE